MTTPETAPMTGLSPGARVRLTAEAAGQFPRSGVRTGTLVRFTRPRRGNQPSALVRFDGRRGLTPFHPDLLEPDDGPAPADPQTAADWQAAVDAADFLLSLDSARRYGLVSGGPAVNVLRCEAVIREGRARGFVAGAAAETRR
jgi:hypothetical protein